MDGVSRLILRSDVEKLKGPSLRASLEQAESLLRTAFDTLQKADGTFQGQENVKLLARFFIRSGLWLCKKSGKGQESRTFESLDEIHEAFKEEASGKAVAGPASSSSASEVLGVDEKVWTLQAPWHIFCMAHFFGVCRHLSFLLAAKKKLFQETGNAIAIAEQQFPWLQKHHNYLKKGEDQIYTFDKMRDKWCLHSFGYVGEIYHCQCGPQGPQSFQAH